ncbi:MAG: hypothetical protein ACJ762_05465 [Solirubrobacteraceae bacterium]
MLAVALLGRNYTPQATVLAESFSQACPDGRLVLLVVDGQEPIPGAEVIGPADIGIDDAELRRRAGLFDPMGVIGSMKAAAVLSLLDQDETVFMLDADMQLLAPLDDLAALARRHGTVLSPHLLEPLAGAPRQWPEEEILNAGAYNGGFLVAGQSGRPALEWLDERLRRDCSIEHLFYGQRWFDLIPGTFGGHVLRDWGVNAAPHVYRGRDIEWRDDRAYLEGAELRLPHYSGFDPANPAAMCRYYGEGAMPDMDLDGRPGLQRLYGAYAERLEAAGWPGQGAWPWLHAADGTPLDKPIRRAYGDALLAAEREGTTEPPDAFSPAFPAWLAEELPGAAGVSRYLAGLHALRSDLQAAFPDLAADAPRLADWARQAPEGHLAHHLLLA